MCRCARCGAKERTRLLALALQRLAPEPSGLPVYHFAPEKALAALLEERYGSNYRPADLRPERYGGMKVPVAQVDLCNPLAHITGPIQGVVHSHVLEHLPCPVERTVRQLNALIAPGGFHVFQVPIFPGWYREDADPGMSVEERCKLFGQSDHVRRYGKNDFQARLLDLFEGFERIELGSAVSPEEIARAAVPPDALVNLTAYSVFFFRKPKKSLWNFLSPGMKTIGQERKKQRSSQRSRTLSGA